MGYASLVCTYLYGAFIAVKATIEGLTQAAKGILKRIDTLVSTHRHLQIHLSKTFFTNLHKYCINGFMTGKKVSIYNPVCYI